MRKDNAPLLEQPAPTVQEVPAQTTALATQDATDSVAMFERMARDPNISVEKVERLMALWERGEAKRSEMAFNVAMSTAQAKMRHVAPDAFNPQTKSKYASYDALDLVLRPIYTEHGFALSFNTADSPQPESIRILCDVTHSGGHNKQYRLDMPADGKGAKGGDVMTKTHAVGSGLSYGMRYLLKMIFNVAVGEKDDDGNAASAKGKARIAEPPKGYEDWVTDLLATADNGTPATQKVWRDEKSAPFRAYMGAVEPQRWTAIKGRAMQADQRLAAEAGKQ